MVVVVFPLLPVTPIVTAFSERGILFQKSPQFFFNQFLYNGRFIRNPGLFMTTVALRIKSSVCPSSSHSIHIGLLVFIFIFPKSDTKTAPLSYPNGSAYATFSSS
jgi:hypothetical protein